MDVIAYKVADAALVVGVSKAHLFRAMRSRQLAYRRTGRTRLIGAKELRDYFESLPVGDPDIDALKKIGVKKEAA